MTALPVPSLEVNARSALHGFKHDAKRIGFGHLDGQRPGAVGSHKYRASKGERGAQWGHALGQNCANAF